MLIMRLLLLWGVVVVARELRARVLKGLGLQQREDEGRIRTLFVNRLAKRRIVNQDDVVAVLVGLGGDEMGSNGDCTVLSF